jgi:cytochrome c-type biogenesis protein CcmH/NrfG
MDKYRAAIAINPCNAFAWADLGDALLSSEDPRSAVSALDAATRLMPTHHQAWTNLGRARERTGDLAAAHAAYTRALDLKPDSPYAAEGKTRTAPR